MSNKTISPKLHLPRRNFLSRFGLAVAGLLTIPLLLKKTWADENACKEPLFVVPGKDMALAMKFEDDVTKVDKNLQIARQGIAFDKQRCATCAVYKADANNKNAYGKCSIFGGKCQTVHASSWCSAWSKGAGV